MDIHIYRYDNKYCYNIFYGKDLRLQEGYGYNLWDVLVQINIFKQTMSGETNEHINLV